jgi:hypothetical protein
MLFVLLLHCIHVIFSLFMMAILLLVFVATVSYVLYTLGIDVRYLAGLRVCNPWECSWRTNGSGSSIIVNFFDGRLKQFVPTSRSNQMIRPMCVHDLWEACDTFYSEYPRYYVMVIKVYKRGSSKKCKGTCTLWRDQPIPMLLAKYHNNVIWEAQPAVEKPPPYTGPVKSRRR